MLTLLSGRVSLFIAILGFMCLGTALSHAQFQVIIKSNTPAINQNNAYSTMSAALYYINGLSSTYDSIEKLILCTPGNYQMNSSSFTTHNINKPNVTIACDGLFNFQISSGATNLANNPVFQLNANDITFRNISISRDTKPSTLQTNASAIDLNGFDVVNIEGCIFVNHYDHIESSASDNPIVNLAIRKSVFFGATNSFVNATQTNGTDPTKFFIVDSLFSSSDQYGLLLTLQDYDRAYGYTIIRSNEFSSIDNMAIQFGTYSSWVRISENFFSDCGTLGVSTDGAIFLDDYCENFMIAENTFDNSDGTGIRLDNYVDNIQIHDNNFFQSGTGNDYGIIAPGYHENLMLQNNRFEDYTYAWYSSNWATSSDVLATGNLLINVTYGVSSISSAINSVVNNNLVN